MRIFIALCITFFVRGAMAQTQQPPLPSPEPSQNANPAGSPLPAPSVPQLIPDDVAPAAPPIPSAPSLPQLDEAFKDNPISTAAADYRNRIEWRRLQNIVTNDSKLKAARVAADAAKTDLEKRKLLRRYYEMFYGKMIALAKTPEMKAYLLARKNELLGILPQPHVRPTPTPSPSPSPKAIPLPAPTPKPETIPAGLPTPLPSPS